MDRLNDERLKGIILTAYYTKEKGETEADRTLIACRATEQAAHDNAVSQVIERLEDAWNKESLAKRNQQSRTLPIWVREALGIDKKDMRLKAEAKGEKRPLRTIGVL